MAALSGDLDRDAIGCRHHRPRVHTHGTRFHLRPVVHAIHRPDREAVKQTVFDHRFGASKTFFSRLENQHRCAVELTRLGQITRGAHQHGGVAVVPTAVHHSGAGGFPGKVILLGDGQRIHVSPQSHHLATAAAFAVDQRHHTGLADAGVDLVDTTHLERLHHALRGVVLFEPDFRMGVQIAPQGGELRVKGSDAGKRTSMGFDARSQHAQCPPAFSTRRRGSTAKYNRSTIRLMITKISAIRHR